MRLPCRMALAALACGAALAGCLPSLTRPTSPPAPGRPAPEVEGADAHGRAFRLGDYRGRVVLLSFWHNA